MPVKSKSLTNARKTKKNRQSSRPLTLSTLGHAFPDRVIITMPYGEVLSRSPAVATDQYNFIVNSVYDPNATGGGHQPMGRDQLLGTIYNQYRVHSVRVRYDFSAYVASGSMSLFYLSFGNDSTVLTVPDAMEQPDTQYKIVQNSLVQHMQAKINLWDLYGQTKAQFLADDLTGAIYTTSPSEPMYLRVGVGTVDSSAITTWALGVKIDMVVECYDRKTIAAS